MSNSIIHADLHNKHYREWVQFLRESESWSRQQIADYQLSEARRIIRYAYENTVAYRSLYDQAGVSPDSIRTLEELRKFPFVEKEMIRDALEDFSVPMEGRTYVTTGGSSGIPFGMYRDPGAFPKELASKAHQYYRVGWREGERQIVLRGQPIPSCDHVEFIPEFNELRCSSYHLTPEWMEIYCQKACEYEPEWLRCYPSSGYLLARFLKEAGRPFPKLKGVLCASENFYDFQKDLIRKVFGGRVFSHYGHYELAALAGYCECEDTYHVLPQYGCVELIGSDGRPVTEPGGIGEIVATSFIMHATPLIRYRTRDLAVFKGWACGSCGRPYQIWERIEGRLQEFIVTRAGRYISMTAINFHDDVFDQIKQFQFYQEERGKVTLRYVPKSGLGDGVLENIRGRLLVKLGDDVALTFHAVDDITVTPRGKRRFLIQKLNIEFHDA